MARIETVRAVSGNDETVAGSFRDPAGFVFRRDGAILRHVAKSYGTGLRPFGGVRALSKPCE